MNRHIARLDLRPQQSRAENDSHALGSHPVHLAMIYHPAKEIENTSFSFPSFKMV